MLKTLVSLATLLIATGSALAEDLNLPSEVTLFKNVSVFDEVNEELQNLDVLVVRNKIHRVEADIPEVETWEVEASTREATRLPAAVEFREDRT